MKLEKTAIQMRERTTWEAIDLSLIFIKHFARYFYPGWFMLTLPLALVLNFVFGGWAIIPILIFWYLKPLFGRLPLFIASRLFFRQSPRLKNFFRNPYRNILKYLIGDLTFRRFSPWRCYSMPVRFLEELRGVALKNRLAIVTRNGRGTAGLLTAVCLVFECGMFFGWIFLLVALFMDSKIFSQLLDFTSEVPLWISSLQFFFYYFSMSVIEPFYILAGFFLYINRRVYLEGWDIELVFKRLANRLTLSRQPKQPAFSGKPAGKGTNLLLISGLLLFTFFPDVNIAAEPHTAPDIARKSIQKQSEIVKQDINSILSGEEFKEYEQREWWKWKHKPTDQNAKTKEQLNPLGELLVKILTATMNFMIRILPWLLVCGIIMIVLLLIIRNRDWFRPAGSRVKGERVFFTSRPDGQKTESFRIPADMLKAADEAWQKGEFRTAIGIIYRGALVFIIFVRKIFLPESATEGECLRLVRQTLTSGNSLAETMQSYDSSLLADFTYLITCWQRVAYAHLPPDQTSFTLLCERWRPYLTAVAELQSVNTPGQADLINSSASTEFPEWERSKE